VVERLGQVVVLGFGVDARHVGRHVRQVEDAAVVEAAGLPVLDAGRMSSRSARPIRSSNLRMPSWAISSRTSSATKKK
jgi:hypothetical protein